MNNRDAMQVLDITMSELEGLDYKALTKKFTNKKKDLERKLKEDIIDEDDCDEALSDCSEAYMALRNYIDSNASSDVITSTSFKLPRENVATITKYPSMVTGYTKRDFSAIDDETLWFGRKIGKQDLSEDETELEDEVFVKLAKPLEKYPKRVAIIKAVDNHYYGTVTE